MPRERVINGDPVTEHDLVCPECGEPMWLRPAFRGSGVFYRCSTWLDKSCPGTHGAHPDGRPLGVPATRKTKDARMAAHHVFDHLWKTKWMSRGAAYRWMQKALGMTADEAHIGRFDRAQCKALVVAFREAYPDLWRDIRGDKG